MVQIASKKSFLLTHFSNPPTSTTHGRPGEQDLVDDCGAGRLLRPQKPRGHAAVDEEGGAGGDGGDGQQKGFFSLHG
jgi:hypothetical protein